MIYLGMFNLYGFLLFIIFYKKINKIIYLIKIYRMGIDESWVSYVELSKKKFKVKSR